MNEAIDQICVLVKENDELQNQINSLEEKIGVYESLLHKIQLNAEVVLNHENVSRLIYNICRWSYAHRVGNGEIPDEEQQKRIDAAFSNLLDIE